MNNRIWLVAFFVSISVGQQLAGANVARAQQLSAEQVSILESLDQTEIDQALAIAEKGIQWRERIRTAADPAQRVEVALAIADEAKALQTQFPELAAPIDHGAKIAPILQKAEQTWKNAEYVAEEYEGITEENFREEAKRRAMQAAADELAKVLEESVFPQLQMLKAPADYAKNFVNGEFKQWISQPISLSGDDSLMARIVPPPQGAPIFAQTTEYGAEIVYMDDLKVKATGIRLEFKPGQATPHINIDNMRVDQNLKDTVLSNVASLGQDFAASSEMPIKVTLNGQPDFAAGLGGQRGGISFNVEIGLLGSDNVSAKGRNLVLYPGNRVDWKEASLEIEVPANPPIPIGTTPFAMWSISGMLNPKTREIMVRTKVSTAATPPNVVGLDVGLTTQVPIKSLKLDGHLIVGTMKFMQTEGIIDFEKGEIAGKFKSSDEGSPLAQLAFADGSFSLKRERFLADGKVDLFGKSFADMHCELDFIEGRGEMYADSGFDLFGVDFANTLTVEIDPGFKRVRMEAMQSLNVASIAPYGSIGVVVTVSADSNSPEKVHVVAEAFGEGLRASFDVPTLAGCTMGKLQEELRKQSVASYHRLLKSLAEGDEDVRKFGAEIEQKTGKYIDEKLGITWRTGVPELDELGGKLSDGVKDVGGAAADMRAQVGGQLSDASKDLQNAGSKAEEKVRNFISKPFSGW